MSFDSDFKYEKFEEYFKFDPIPPKTEVIERIILSQLDFMPGTQFQYSDLGMIILKEIIVIIVINNSERFMND